MQNELKKKIKACLQDAAGYAKSAKTAVHYSDREAFASYINGARTMLDRAESLLSPGAVGEVFVRDDSCHWYLIPVESSGKFYELLNGDSFGPQWEEFEDEFSHCRINSGPENVPVRRVNVSSIARSRTPTEEE